LEPSRRTVRAILSQRREAQAAALDHGPRKDQPAEKDADDRAALH
jgi:hypothetical protein